MKRNKQQKEHAKRVQHDTAIIRGLDRKAHFDSGGSLAEWRGNSAVHSSNKRNSRGISKRKSIKDSEE